MSKRHILMEEKFIAERLREKQAGSLSRMELSLQNALTLDEEELALHKGRRFTKRVDGKDIYIEDHVEHSTFIFGDESIADGFLAKCKETHEVKA